MIYPAVAALHSATKLGGLCRHCTSDHWFGGFLGGVFVGWVPRSTVDELLAWGFLAWNELHTKLHITPTGKEYLTEILEPPCVPSNPSAQPPQSTSTTPSL